MGTWSLVMISPVSRGGWVLFSMVPLMEKFLVQNPWVFPSCFPCVEEVELHSGAYLLKIRAAENECPSHLPDISLTLTSIWVGPNVRLSIRLRRWLAQSYELLICINNILNHMIKLIGGPTYIGVKWSLYGGTSILSSSSVKLATPLWSLATSNTDYL